MLDELPVGGGNNDMFKDELPPGPEKNDDADKPLDERLDSKNWSTRADAYKELTEEFKQSPPNCKNDTFQQHSDRWPVFLADGNPGSLEKAVECFQMFVDKAHPSIVTAVQVAVLQPLVEKCLSHAKPVIKTKSMEATLSMFQVSESFEEELMEKVEALLTNKNVKVQGTSVMLLAQLLQAFGIKRFAPKRFGSHIETAANSSNPAVRQEAINCYKALFLHVGVAVDALIENLKQQQKDALKKEFDELKANPPQNYKRYTRSEAEKMKQSSLDGLITEESKKEEQVDAFDLAAPKDLTKYNGAWQDEVIAMKKWDEKRDRLIELTSEAGAPKLGSGDFIGLTAMLKKLMMDSNIVVSQNAVKAIGALAKGLRQGFSQFAKELTALLFSRFKEKRLTDDVHTALDNILLGVKLGDLLEFVPAGLNDPSPTIKKNVAVFIERALLITYIDDFEEIKGEILPMIAQVADDKDADVREQGLKTLGICVGRLGQAELQKFTDGLNAQKKSKVDEAAATVQPSKYDKSGRKAAAEEAAKKKQAVAAAKKPVAKPKQEIQADVDMEELPPPKKGGIVLDVNDCEVSKPVSKPPNIGKKPPPRVQKPEESKKPATSKPSGVAREQVEDEGAGLSKEEALAKVGEFFNSGTVAKFDDAKWQTKKEGFEEMQAEIAEKKPPADVLEATAKFVKLNMKDWKESNVNLLKEAINVLKCMTEHCDRVPKRAVATYSAFLVDKIGDVKVSTTVKDLVVVLAEFVTCKFMAMQILKHATTTKAPNNLKESCTVLSMLIEEFGGSVMPVKETIDYATLCANSPNVQVRNAAMQLFASLYKHLGQPIRSFLTDIKDSTMKLIEAEFAKITPLKKGEFKSTREVKGDAMEEMAAGGAAGGGLDDALPREDISKQMTAKLFELSKDKDWKKRKEFADKVEAILRAAKMRIKPEGLNELMDVMKNGMKESNKAVMKSNLSLLGLLVESLGVAAKNLQKKLLAPMVFQLSDKQSLVRADVVSAMDKWSEAIGAECVINQIALHLTTENPELREEGFKWILANKDVIPKCDTASMVKPLISCMTDKNAKIRSNAEEVIVMVMNSVGFQAFSDGIKDLKTALQQTVRPMLEKARSKCSALPAPVAVEAEVAEPAKVALQKSIPSGPTLKKQPIALAKENTPPKKDKLQNSFSQAGLKTPAKTASFLQPAVASEEDFSINAGNKERRAQADLKNKWMHEELKPEQVDKVKTVCEQVFGHEYMKTKMFSVDFKKHVLVIQDFATAMTTQPEALVEILDVVFKWCFVRLTESANTTFAVNVFDFMTSLFEFLATSQYQLWDTEAYIVLPMLCDKAGLNNAILKEKVKKLIKMSFDVYDPRKAMGLIIKFGVANKNLKSVAESLDEVALYIAEKGVDTLTEKDLKFIAKLADSNDKGVREQSLCVLAEIFKALDEGIWRVIGTVTPKVKGLLEARFKKQKGSGTLGLSMTSRNQPSSVASSEQNSLNRSLVGGQLKKTAATPRSLQFNKVGPSSGSEVSNLNRSINDNQNRSNGTFTSASKNPPLATLSRPQTAQIPASKLGGGMQSQLRPLVSVEKNETLEAELFKQDQEMQEPKHKTDMFPDDDEDLRQHISDLQLSEDKVSHSPRTKGQMDEVMKNVQQLKYGNLGKRVDSLVNLNDIIQKTSEYEKALGLCANELVIGFNHVLVDIFERPTTDIPIRFAKYFVTIVNKACSCKEIMREVDEKHCSELTEQLLTRLLIEGLNDNKEGELILKNLNASMLRMLENCNHTYIFCVLFNHLRKYKDSKTQPRLPGLIIKCLLKLSKILEKLIDKLDMERVLLAIHLYMTSVNHETKTSNDEMGIRIVKTVVNELVKIKKDSIWRAYQVVEDHEKEDNHIKRWIKIIISSLQNAPDAAQKEADRESVPIDPRQLYFDREIRGIIDDLRNSDSFELTIPRLRRFVDSHPGVLLETYLKDLAPNFAERIRRACEQRPQKEREPDGRATFTPAVNNFFEDKKASQHGEQPQDTPSSQPSKFKRSSDLGNSYGPSSQEQEDQAAKTGLKVPLSSRPMTTMASASKQAEIPSTATNEDRINQYQSKLSSMREKFSQRKSLLPQTQKQPSHTPVAQAQHTGQMNTSFSAMNSSLQAKWSAISSKNKDSSLAGDKPMTPLSSTMVGNAPATHFVTASRTSIPPGNSLGGSSLNQSNNAESSGAAGATNLELNRRLADMKSKLQALKKKD